MKKLFVVLVAIIFASCSQDQVESSNPITMDTPLSVLDGDLLSYKDDTSFIKEYSELSEYKTKNDLQNWISKKGHKTFLNSIDVSLFVSDSIVDTSKIIYSDALKAILNTDSKLKINNKVIWLDENTFYELTKEDYSKNSQELKTYKNDLAIYGSITNGYKSIANKKNAKTSVVIPNINGASANYSIEGSNYKRYYMTIFNETIVINNVYVSKMYLNSSMTYRTGSFFRGYKWNNDAVTTRTIVFNINTSAPWDLSYNLNNSPFSVVGSQTILIATLGAGPYVNFDFVSSGNIVTTGFNNYIWTQAI